MQTQASTNEIRQLLADMDSLFDGFFAWLGRQHDAESGGFYYAASSRELSVSRPDIESTAQALGIRFAINWRVWKHRSLEAIKHG